MSTKYKTSLKDKIDINIDNKYIDKTSDPFNKSGYKSLSTDTKLLNNNFQPNKVFSDNIQPQGKLSYNMCKYNYPCENNSTYTYLNKLGPQPSSTFVKVGSNYFTTRPDARLLDSSHNYNMGLDTRPIQVEYDMFHDNISGNVNYGKNYHDYSSVTGGQIEYYIDNDFREAFYSPVYGMKSKSVGVMYKDPMDNIKPMYNKEYSRDEIKDGLSFINDTTKFRDDIISRQQRVHNSQKYELYYGK